MLVCESKTMQLETLVADDEEPSRQRLIRLLEKHSDIEVVAQAASGMEVLSGIKQSGARVLFLDIQMPPPNGLEVAAELLEEKDPPLVVFLTAYSEHAVEAFELSAVDYLVKPVKPERLRKTLERLRQAAQDRWGGEQGAGRARPEDTIALRDEKSEGRVLVSFSEIDYFMSHKEKCYARVRGREYEVNSTLTGIYETLPEGLFLRTHRGYVVNLKKVKEAHPWFHRAFNLVLEDGSQVPLSRGYVAAFRQRTHWF